MTEHKFSDLCHWTPKQQAAHDLLNTIKYLLIGGAGGGGKSYFLRWESLYRNLKWAKEGHKGVMSGIFCEDFPRLRDRQIIKVKAEFPDWLGRWNDSEHNFYLKPAYGSGILAFRNLDDPQAYDSVEFASIAIDELTRNRYETFTSLRKRLRWPGIEDCKFMAGTNPGGVGMGWVKQLWFDKKFEPGEMEADLFAFLPALCTDNPYNPESYLAQLAGLPEKLRAAFRDGNWDTFEGQYFSEWDRNIHVVRPFTVPQEWERFISLDYGYGAGASSVGFWAVDYGSKAYRYDELYLHRLTYSQLAMEVLQKCGSCKIGYAVGDPAIWGDRPHKDTMIGESGGETMANIFWPGQNDRDIWIKRAEAGIPRSQVFTLQKGDNSRVTGWGKFREYLLPVKDQHGNISPRLQVFNNCVDFIRTIPAMVHDSVNPEDLDTAGEDHCADETRLFLMSRPVTPIKPGIGAKENQYRWKDRQDTNGYMSV
jgi:hypothetical protein